jgi:hypothetical protein
MTAYAPPWKLALIGVVALFAGVALFVVDWNIAQLAAFVAMLLIARGALHIVTTTFEGVVGALSALQGASEFAAGILLLLWPHPTVLVVVVVVGALVLVVATVDATVALASRKDRAHWREEFGADVVEVLLGVALLAQSGASVNSVAITIGILMVFVAGLDIARAVTRGRAAKHAVKDEPVIVEAEAVLVA